MNTTINQNDAEKAEKEGYRKALEDAHRQVRSLLKTLPRETVNDLTELLKQFVEEDSEQLRDEIAQTIQEVLFPDSLSVELMQEFDLTHEDDYVRNKLTAYRQRVGQEIKERRLNMGLSQMELAEKAGISQSHLCRLETGMHVPTFATVERIAAALETVPSQLDPGFAEDA